VKAPALVLLASLFASALATAEDRSSEVSGLLITLKSEKPAERAAAARILGEIGPQAKDAVGPLTEAVADPERDVRINAATALGHIGKAAAPAVPALVTALSDKEWQVRRAAATALGRTGSKDAEKPLKQAQKDKVEGVRNAAKQGLRDLKKASKK
jgi:HEAT repeat protein